MPDEPRRVMLVDDQPLFRRAIATLIAEQSDFVVVGEATNGAEAIEQARVLRPDLIVMDVEMPVMNGVEAVKVLRDEMPDVRILVLTVSEDEEYLFDAVRFGAHGYLLKDLQPEQLYEMMRAVCRGETPISPVMAGRLLSVFRAQDANRSDAGMKAPASPSAAGQRNHLPPAPRAPADAGNPEPERTYDARQRALASPAADLLTMRELEILQYVADGLSNKEIGAILSITEGTVKNHVHNALEKLQFENRIQAAAYVVREGFARQPVGRAE